MELLGQPGDTGKVVIDASKLPDASFNPPFGFPAARTGAIRMGRGFNKIEWLKIIGNPSGQALSVIDTDLIWGGVSRVRIAHSFVTGGRIGIDIRNTGPASAGRIVEAEIVDNEITGNLVSDPGTQQGQGIVIQNANGVPVATIRVALKGNIVHGNIIGMRIFNNNAANNSNISVTSHADKFDENKLGIYMIAGQSRAANTTANGNFISFEAHRTSIQNNQGIQPDAVTLPCGIYLSGGTSALAGSETSDNRLKMKLTGCNISGNEGSDIIVFGAFSTTPALAGTNNIVDIQLHGLIKKTTVVATPSSPVEPTATNIINIGK